jgi:hypothetical protein
MLSFNTLDNPFFRSFVYQLDPKYPVMCPQTAKNRIEILYNRVVSAVSLLHVRWSCQRPVAVFWH